jgi:hypothetical protein
MWKGDGKFTCYDSSSESIRIQLNHMEKKKKKKKKKNLNQSVFAIQLIDSNSFLEI